MSKATVKKLLRSMSKEDIIEMVIEMYDARKEAKEYLEYYAQFKQKQRKVKMREMNCKWLRMSNIS